MKDIRPHLIQAYVNWIECNNLTTYMLVDASVKGTIVPVEKVKDGKIVLNLSSIATTRFQLSDEAVSFGARFSGRHWDIVVPIPAVLAVYGREDGKGIFFEREEVPSQEEPTNIQKEEPAEPRKKPSLSVVK